MAFSCNKCFVVIASAENPNEGASYLSSCLHILCNNCSQQMLNNMCAVCNKQCKIVKIAKDMPAVVKTYFEPPLVKVDQLQQHFRFLKYQEELAMKLKNILTETEKEAAYRKQLLSVYEKKANAEKERLEASCKAKNEEYKRLKEEYQNLASEEQRLLKRVEADGYPNRDPNVKDMSSDSGVHSSDKSSRFEH